MAQFRSPIPNQPMPVVQSVVQPVVYRRYRVAGGAAVVPPAPINVTAVGGDTDAQVFFESAGDGGAPITNFRATSSPGGLFEDGLESPLVVSGLTNGTPYTFTVVATNSVGNSAASAPSNSVTPSPAQIAATGGTITDIPGWRVHTFNTSGEFVVTQGGDGAEYLVVAGGGGGGRTANSAGGGGAGGYRTGGLTLAVTTYLVIVGAGGNGGTANGVDGSPGGDSSVFGTASTRGGGGEAAGTPGANQNGGSGGGSNGGAVDGVLNFNGTGVAGQGFAGGTGWGDSVTNTNRTSGGGGGAGAVGVAAASGAGGAGGPGLSSSIDGTPTFRGGGGGGASVNIGAFGTGGNGGGGNGSAGVTAAQAGTPNTGGGGGGGASGNGGNGGSGVVIIRYPHGIAPVDANKLVWLRQGIGVTHIANAVSQWADQSGGAHHVNQGTVGKQPMLQPDNSILFDGIDDGLLSGAFTMPAIRTVYIRFKQITWGTSLVILDALTGNTAAVNQNPSPPTLTGAGGPPDNSDLPIGQFGSFAYGSRNNNTARWSQVSGFAEVFSASILGSNANGLAIGTWEGTIRFSNIQVVEVIIYNVEHTPAEVAQCLAYLDSLTP
jgi:hypothetical protein